LISYLHRNKAKQLFKSKAMYLFQFSRVTEAQGVTCYLLRDLQYE